MYLNFLLVHIYLLNLNLFISFIVNYALLKNKYFCLQDFLIASSNLPHIFCITSYDKKKFNVLLDSP